MGKRQPLIHQVLSIPEATSRDMANRLNRLDTLRGETVYDSRKKRINLQNVGARSGKRIRSDGDVNLILILQLHFLMKLGMQEVDGFCMR